MYLKCLQGLRGQTHIMIQSAQMSQRQARKFPKKPFIKTVIHKEMAEEQAQREYETLVMKDGRITKQSAQIMRQTNPEQLSKIQKECEGKDLPIPGLHNPFEKPQHRCVLCEHDVHLDYKNVRLLSQFVSSHTGLIYGREKTGLCIYMQRRISTLIGRARRFGYMPMHYKTPEYVTDVKLFDPFSGPFKRKLR